MSWAIVRENYISMRTLFLLHLYVLVLLVSPLSFFSSYFFFPFIFITQLLFFHICSIDNYLVVNDKSNPSNPIQNISLFLYLKNNCCLSGNSFTKRFPQTMFWRSIILWLVSFVILDALKKNQFITFSSHVPLLKQLGLDISLSALLFTSRLMSYFLG